MAEISSNSVTSAWARAFLEVFERRTLSPLVVHMDTSQKVDEDRSPILQILDSFLINSGDPTCETTANTIFPASLWNPDQPRQALFDRYLRAWPKIKRVRANQHGTYFHRMISYEEGENGNQLEFIIRTWGRGNHRRSALQIGILDPRRDHVHNRRRGFPCLQQVALIPQGRNGSGGLALTAFYPLEYIVDRGLGNYLGLQQLGRFLGHEMEMQLTSLTVVASVAELGKHNLAQYESLKQSIMENFADETDQD